MIGYQFLLELDAQTNAGVDITLRYCCDPGYTGGGHVWEPRIVDPGMVRTALVSGGKTTGASTASYGGVKLGNFKPHDEISGPLDLLRTYRFYGRSARMYVGLATADFPDGFTRAYTAVVELPSINADIVDFPLRGRQSELDVPFDTGTFAGTNVLPDGLEGGSDLKDKTKSALLGRAANFPLTLCNSAKLIYAATHLTGLSVNEINSDLHVFDDAVELYCDGVVTDIEDDAAAPGAGKFTASATGYIRFGSPPIGPVTCSAAQSGYALTAKPANLVAYLLNTSGHGDMIDAASFAAFNAIDGYERGVYLTDKPNISTIIDTLLSPVGYWCYSPLGTMRLGALSDPATLTPVFTFDSVTNIKSVTRRKALDTKGGAPASRVTVRYDRNYTVQAQPAAGISAERKAWLSDEWRLHSKDAPADIIQPGSEEMVFDTACTHLNTFHTEELAVIYCAERELVDIEIARLEPEEFLTIAALLQGECVVLDLHGRWDYSGKHMIVDASLVNYANETATITVWG